VVSDVLASVLDEATVGRLASVRSFERGAVYLSEGRVGPLRVSAGRVVATVAGTESYEVGLAVVDGELRFACSCPMGGDGVFCKHCVAVALCWLGSRGDSVPTLADARTHLLVLSREVLTELLIDHAHHDESLARRLLLMTTRAGCGAGADAAALCGLIDQCFAHGGFVSWREMPGYVRGIEETTDALEGLLADGSGDAVVGLVEYALELGERAIAHADDSGGLLGSALERLGELHLEACRRARPDPVALAEWLFERELGGDWDLFDGAVVRYADVLGATGVARYGELATGCWAGVPALGPGEVSADRFGARLRITRIMEALTERSGSLTDQIAVRERDLASPYRFLEVAELCRAHGEDDLALEWAQRGLSAFPTAPDERVRRFLIEEYRRRGRQRDALELSAAGFLAHPTLESYRELAADPQALGEWPRRREAALAELRTPAPDAPGSRRHPSLRGRGHSELVRVLIWEEDVEAAWRAARDGGCTPSLWLELAERRRAQHPSDALGVYRQHVEDTIAYKDKRSYAEAVQLIDETIRPLFAESGRAREFAGYLEEVRATHRQKRNLIKLLDRLSASTAP